MSARLTIMDLVRFGASPVGELVDIHGTDGRFQEEYHHQAFVPADLGEEPTLSTATWHRITAASRALARLDQASMLVSAPELLRHPTLRREAQSTSALEGTFAPLEDVLAADASEEDVTGDLREVLNYIEAADFAFDSLISQPAITKSLLEQAHAILVEGTEADTADKGRVRQCQVAIGSSTGRIRDSRFVPMPPGADLDDSVRRLITWCEEALEQDIEPIVAAAMAHYQFETLHPFNDGNGRIGRLLIVLQFLRYNLIRNPLLSVSPWFEQRRSEYQEGLANVSISGDWDPWVQFFARGIGASAEDTARRVERLSSVQKQFVDKLQAENASGSIRDIVDRLIATPIVTVPRLSAALGKTRPAINTAVTRLVDMGILRGPYGTYNRRFVAQDILDAIQAPMGQVPKHDEPIRANRPSRTGESEDRPAASEASEDTDGSAGER